MTLTRKGFQMIRNTAFAEAFVNAAASAINQKGRKAPWMARTVVDRVTHTKTGVVREPDIAVKASFKARKEIQRTCKVVV